MAEFNPNIIKSVADDLYRRANNTVASYTLLGVLMGAAIGIATSAQSQNTNASIIVISILAVIFGGIGLSLGKSKAFSLKLEAQKILLDLQIEKNTRPKIVHDDMGPTIRPGKDRAE